MSEWCLGKPDPHEFVYVLLNERRNTNDETPTTIMTIGFVDQRFRWKLQHGSGGDFNLVKDWIQDVLCWRALGGVYPPTPPDNYEVHDYRGIKNET